MMLFLNKTGFRGVYRENKQGIYNAPFGHYENPIIVDDENLREVSALIQPVHFTCQDFQEALLKIQPGDFVYFDPPYVPQSETTFDTYVADGFSKESHEALFGYCQTLREKKIQFVLSNAYVPFVLERFPEPTFKVYMVMAKRAIHNKNPAATTNEVLITNE